MIKAAITGNIASGKSCVEQYIINAGFKVLDLDKVNHEILLHNKLVIDKIKNAFSDYDILSQDGTISREKLGNIVFSNPDKLKLLESILYKEISNKINEFFMENSDEKIVFVSAAMLFESGFYKDYDKIIFVSSDSEIRLKRLIIRNKYPIEYAKKRICAQQNEEEKINLSDFVIFNNSDFNNLKFQTDNIIKKLTNL